MAQKPLKGGALEIEEFDQANNLVATYIESTSTGSGSRIDIIVSPLPFIAMGILTWNSDSQEFKQLCEECPQCFFARGVPK